MYLSSTAPVRERFAALAAYLIAEKLDLAFVNAIVVWFDDPRPVLVSELNWALLLDCGSEQIVDLRFWRFHSSLKALLRVGWPYAYDQPVFAFAFLNPSSANHRSARDTPSKVYLQGASKIVR